MSEMAGAQVIFETSDEQELEEILDRIEESDSAYLQDCQRYY